MEYNSNCLLNYMTKKLIFNYQVYIRLHIFGFYKVLFYVWERVLI